MKAKTESSKQGIFIHGPCNSGHNGFILLYHPSSRVAPFFTKVQPETASSLSPSDVIHPYSDAPRIILQASS